MSRLCFYVICVLLTPFNAAYNSGELLTVWLANAQYIVLPKHTIFVLENVVSFTCFAHGGRGS